MMDQYTATEMAFKHGYEKGFEAGKPKWIPVSERLPGLHHDVLMYFKDDDNMAAGYLDDVDEDRAMWCAYSDGGYWTDCDYEPTHWMPLPEPPKEEPPKITEQTMDALNKMGKAAHGGNDG